MKKIIISTILFLFTTITIAAPNDVIDYIYFGIHTNPKDGDLYIDGKQITDMGEYLPYSFWQECNEQLLCKLPVTMGTFPIGTLQLSYADSENLYGAIFFPNGQTKFIVTDTIEGEGVTFDFYDA